MPTSRILSPLTLMPVTTWLRKQFSILSTLMVVNCKDCPCLECHMSLMACGIPFLQSSRVPRSWSWVPLTGWVSRSTSTTSLMQCLKIVPTLNAWNLGINVIFLYFLKLKTLFSSSQVGQWHGEVFRQESKSHWHAPNQVSQVEILGLERRPVVRNYARQLWACWPTFCDPDER